MDEQARTAQALRVARKLGHDHAQELTPGGDPGSLFTSDFDPLADRPGVVDTIVGACGLAGDDGRVAGEYAASFWAGAAHRCGVIRAALR